MIILKTKKDKKDFTKLTVVQVIGENNCDNLIEKYKDKSYKKNIDFEWYVYPKDISIEELKQEIIDLLPFMEIMRFKNYLRALRLKSPQCSIKRTEGRGNRIKISWVDSVTVAVASSNTATLKACT